MTNSLHFSITGEFLTETVRNLMLSDTPGKAWKLTQDALQGATCEQVQGILDGTLQLIGENDLQLVSDDNEDETEQYLKDMRYIYAGRVRHQGCWYRPAARTRINREAAEHASSHTEEPSNGGAYDRQHWAKMSVDWFARPGEVVLRVDGQWLLFAPCGERPFWWPEVTLEAALAEYKAAGRKLEERGKATRSQSATEAATRLRAEADDLHASADQAAVEALHAREEEKHARYVQQLEEIRVEVMKRAGKDTFALTVGPSRTVTVPRAPFYVWALERTSLAHLAPPWTLISPVGLKLPLDSAAHSDWMIGAGLSLEEDYHYNALATLAAYEEKRRIQEEVGNFAATVIVDSGVVSGIVGEDIAVLPNLSPTHLAEVMALSCRGIITEEGGALAHLATLGRERSWTIMRVKDAVKLYPQGIELVMVPENGELTISSRRPYSKGETNNG